jgi:hypothetical protein
MISSHRLGLRSKINHQIKRIQSRVNIQTSIQSKAQNDDEQSHEDVAPSTLEYVHFFFDDCKLRNKRYTFCCIHE